MTGVSLSQKRTARDSHVCNKEARENVAIK
jgi:hypothetical protein